jgi:hypothetical protein
VVTDGRAGAVTAPAAVGAFVGLVTAGAFASAPSSSVVRRHEAGYGDVVSEITKTRAQERAESERLERLIAERVAGHDEWKPRAKQPFEALIALGRRLEQQR